MDKYTYANLTRDCIRASYLPGTKIDAVALTERIKNRYGIEIDWKRVSDSLSRLAEKHIVVVRVNNAAVFQQFQVIEENEQENVTMTMS